MIKINKFEKSYGSKNIIKDWKFEFENGKIYGLIGRNGKGKTTILKCMSGLCISDQIDIHTEKGDVSNKDYLSRDIIYVSDDPTYYNDLTLREHLWIICRVEKYSKNESLNKMNYYIDAFKMQEYLDYYPAALSKGTLQRMMLIMGLLRKTENLLLDEPFNGLDPIQLMQALQCCKKSSKEGKCIIISSHDIESLSEICDEYLIFTKSKIKSIQGNINRSYVNKLIGDSYEENTSIDN